VRGIRLSQLNDVNTLLPNVGFRFARILLLLSLIFLPVLTFVDYQAGYLLPAYAKGFLVIVCTMVYFLCRDECHQELVCSGVAASLLIVASVGSFYKLDGFSGMVCGVCFIFFIFFFGGNQKRFCIFSSLFCYLWHFLF